MNPRGCDEQKKSILCAFKKNILKITIKQLISLDIDDFFKGTPVVDENQASVTGNTQEEENASEKTRYDADENIEENEIIHKNKDKVVTI